MSVYSTRASCFTVLLFSWEKFYHDITTSLSIQWCIWCRYTWFNATSNILQMIHFITMALGGEGYLNFMGNEVISLRLFKYLFIRARCLHVTWHSLYIYLICDRLVLVLASIFVSCPITSAFVPSLLLLLLFFFFWVRSGLFLSNNVSYDQIVIYHSNVKISEF